MHTTIAFDIFLFGLSCVARLNNCCHLWNLLANEGNYNTKRFGIVIYEKHHFDIIICHKTPIYGSHHVPVSPLHTIPLPIHLELIIHGVLRRACTQHYPSDTPTLGMSSTLPVLHRHVSTVCILPWSSPTRWRMEGSNFWTYFSKDGSSLDITVCRKPTQIYQYWTSGPTMSRRVWPGACTTEQRVSAAPRMACWQTPPVWWPEAERLFRGLHALFHLAIPPTCGRPPWGTTCGGEQATTEGVSEDIRWVCRKYSMYVVINFGQPFHSVQSKMIMKGPLPVEKQWHQKTEYRSRLALIFVL